MADRWIALRVCGCLILQAEAPRSWKWEDLPWAAADLFVCTVYVCVHVLRILCPHRSWLLVSLVWSPTQCLPSLCLYLCVSPSISWSPLLLLLTNIVFSHQHSILFLLLSHPLNLTLSNFLAFFFWSSQYVIWHSRGCSLPLSPLSFFFFFLHPSILELKSCNHSLICWTPLCLTFSSAPLVCDVCPWSFPPCSLPSLLYTQWSQPSFPFFFWPVPQCSG